MTDLLLQLTVVKFHDMFIRTFSQDFSENIVNTHKTWLLKSEVTWQILEMIALLLAYFDLNIRVLYHVTNTWSIWIKITCFKFSEKSKVILVLVIVAGGKNKEHQKNSIL